MIYEIELNVFEFHKQSMCHIDGQLKHNRKIYKPAHQNPCNIAPKDVKCSYLLPDDTHSFW